MSEHNPWRPEPLPSSHQVRQIVSEAMSDWIQRASLPHTLLANNGDPIELRQQQLFYIHQIVNTIMSNQADETETMIKDYLGTKTTE